MSAMTSSIAGNVFASARPLTVVASMSLVLVTEAPSCAISSAICSALRVVVPSSSIAATKLARPGRSGGLASLPVFITRLAATIGRPRRSLRMIVSPFGSTADAGVAIRSGRSRLGLGISPRHVSSALMDCPPWPAGASSAFPDATGASGDGCPGTA